MGALVELGTDHEGRTITYDEAAHLFAIGGIATTVDRIVAYDRGKQITWLNDEMRTWAYECDSSLRDYVAAEADKRARAAQPQVITRDAATHSCATCAFSIEWVPHGVLCRRFPPRVGTGRIAVVGPVIRAEHMGYIPFPATRGEWWCGEWRATWSESDSRPFSYPG